LKYSLLIIILPSVIATPPPLCNFCNCDTDRANNVEVVCTGQSELYIFENIYWFDSNNRSYSYKSLTLENASFLTLDRKFPESAITQLDLSHNSIVNIEGCVFAGLEKIEILTMSHNNLRSLNCLGLETLRDLYLDHNNISSLKGGIFEKMKNLEVLDLSHNPLSQEIDDETFNAIANLIHLKVLDLSYTTIKSLSQKVMQKLKELTVLNLSGNYFTKIPKTLQHSRSLTQLYFNDNPVYNLTSKHGMTKTLSSLKIFHMSHAKRLRFMTNKALMQFPNLEEIYITNNPELYVLGKFTFCSYGRHPRNNFKCPPIKKLHLQNNKLETISDSLVQNWSQLTDLDLTNNPWSCDCENQWLVDELMPLYLHLDEEKAKSLKCAAPPEMESYTLFELYEIDAVLECPKPYFALRSVLYPYDAIVVG
ncbi:LRR 8 domain containing protein, partial [Asbolus verrucosus]